MLLFLYNIERSRPRKQTTFNYAFITAVENFNVLKTNHYVHEFASTGLQEKYLLTYWLMPEVKH